MKSLVVYYSRTGRTRIAAEAIRKVLKSNIVEIKELKDRRGLIGFLQAGRDATLGIKTVLEKIEAHPQDYDLIIVGTPVWASKPTPAILSFLEASNLRNKKVALFVTMMLFGGRKTLDILAKKVKEKGGEVIASIALRTFFSSASRIGKRACKFSQRLAITNGNCDCRFLLTKEDIFC